MSRQYTCQNANNKQTYYSRRAAHARPGKQHSGRPSALSRNSNNTLYASFTNWQQMHTNKQYHYSNRLSHTALEYDNECKSMGQSMTLITQYAHLI